MANALFDKGREKHLNGYISWTRDDIKLALVDTATYSVDLVNDEFLSDIPGGEIVATSGNFTAKTTTAGVADAADVVLSAVSGDQSEALVIYRDVPSATGTGDSVNAPDGSGIQTLTDSAGLFTAAMERGWLVVSGAGTGGNNGAFFITEFVDANNIKFYNPAGGSETSSFTWSTESPLIAYIDTATGLPVTPNGGDITIAWDSGANKIFKL